MEDVDVSTCRKCGGLEVRKQDGYFPDGKNKRFVDAKNAQWNGRTCPSCQKKNVKTQVKQKRANAKSGHNT